MSSFSLSLTFVDAHLILYKLTQHSATLQWPSWSLRSLGAFLRPIIVFNLNIILRELKIIE